MNDQNFTLTFSVDQSPEEVLAAIKNVRGWWSEGIEGAAEKIGDVFRYRHKDVHDTKQRMTELVPGKTIAWLVTESNLTFLQNPREWKGTELRFDISKNGTKTDVRFTQIGLVRSIECYDACSKGWTYYVGTSLRKLITTRKGQPDKSSDGELAMLA